MEQITKKAIKNAGGVVLLAKAIGTTPSAISQWEHVPVKRVLAVEKVSGVSRYELRPDIYGEEK